MNFSKSYWSCFVKEEREYFLCLMSLRWAQDASTIDWRIMLWYVLSCDTAVKYEAKEIDF